MRIEDPPWHFYLPLAINGTLACGTILTLIFLFRQAKAAEGSAKSAEVSANAAKASADALLLADRPWLLMNPNEWNPKMEIFGNLDMAHVATMSVAIKNIGKTPARLDAISIRFQVFDSLDDIPNDPAFAPGELLNGKFLAHGDSLAYRTNLKVAETFTSELAQQIQHGKKRLFAFGYIRYTDMYGVCHETRAGLVWNFAWGNGQLQPKLTISQGGPASYNRAD